MAYDYKTQYFMKNRGLQKCLDKAQHSLFKLFKKDSATKILLIFHERGQGSKVGQTFSLNQGLRSEKEVNYWIIFIEFSTIAFTWVK